eukprot:1650029-Rhodomonas_salina.3
MATGHWRAEEKELRGKRKKWRRGQEKKNSGAGKNRQSPEPLRMRTLGPVGDGPGVSVEARKHCPNDWYRHLPCQYRELHDVRVRGDLNDCHPNQPDARSFDVSDVLRFFRTYVGRNNAVFCSTMRRSVAGCVERVCAVKLACACALPQTVDHAEHFIANSESPAVVFTGTFSKSHNFTREIESKELAPAYSVSAPVDAQRMLMLSLTWGHP